MAVLNSWQKLDRVLTGLPFGNGSDGAYSSATIPTIVYKTCAGTATQTKFAADTDATPFAVGDVILLHQTRGTGVGQWEVVRVASLGSDEYNTTTALNYSYTDSGASQAQAVKILQYTDVTVQSGTWTVPTWDGNIGGILPIAVKGTLTVTGTITGNSVGFSGGPGNNGGQGYSGESSTGDHVASTAANGSGGGGGGAGGDRGSGGAGAGHATSGSGSSSDSGGAATGGDSQGAADLTSIFLGAGGGGGGSSGKGVGNGGAGAGIVLIFGKNITITGTIPIAGEAGGVYASDYANGGGGAGGSVLIVCATATLGSGLITSAAGGATVKAGAGSTGRIAVHHSGTVTGTTSPTFTDVEDTSLVESAGAFFALL
jgi:hypothetical protein